MERLIISTILLLSTLISIVVAIYIYRLDRKSEINKSLFWILFSGGIWVLFSFLIYNFPNRQLLSSISMFGVFIPVLIAIFILSFFGKITKKIKILLLLPTAILSLLCNIPNLMMTGMVVKNHTIISTTFGSIYWIITAYTILILGYVFWLIVSNYKSVEGIKKLQLIYIIIGYTVAAISGTFFAIILPSMNVYDYAPFGHMFMVVLTAGMAYAVTKHYLYDLTVILSELLAILLIMFGFVWLIATPSLFNTLLYILVLSVSILFIKAVVSVAEKNIKLNQNNAKLEADRDELKKLDRLKDEFLQMATHELNTPISIIKGRLSLILGPKANKYSAAQKEDFIKINTDIERLSQLSKDILNVARIDQNRIILNKTDFDLMSLVQEAAADLKIKAANKRVKISFVCDDHKLQVNADESKILEVIANLLTNAIKFSHFEGKVDVCCKKEDNKAIVRVKDFGIGIELADQGKIFQKFFQSGRFNEKNPTEQQGSGLGLYISKKMIELQGGEIGFESLKDIGSTFYFTLPLK